MFLTFEVGLFVGFAVGCLDGGELLGSDETLGAEVMSTQVNVPLSNSTHESKIASPTSATTSLMVFHPSSPPVTVLGFPRAVSLEVIPSASTLG